MSGYIPILWLPTGELVVFKSWHTAELSCLLINRTVIENKQLSFAKRVFSLNLSIQ